MKKLILALALLTCSFTNAQTIRELYANRDFKSLVKHENDANLTGEDLYMIGYAFFQLADDDKAVVFYDKAIAKGNDSASVHYYKALSLRYAKKYDESIAAFDAALKKDPTNQEYMSEKGLVYYYNQQYDKALPVFIEARKLPNTYNTPFYMVPHIYQMKEQYDKALAEFYIALNSISKGHEYYAKTWFDIGQLEYVHAKNYGKSARAYTEALILEPSNYAIHPKLMKAYNAGKEFAKADSIFSIMKIAYKNNALAEDEMKYGNTAVHEFTWKGQKLSIHRYFKDPEELLDLSFKIYLLNKAGDKIERTFTVEKTLQIEDGPKHLLCETEKGGGHRTYPFGWATDTIPVADLQEAVLLVLDDKMTAGAAFRPGKQ